MNQKNKKYQWVEYGTTLYLSVMFFVFPLYYQDNYFNILEAKTSLFQNLTLMYLIISVILVWLVSVFKAEDIRKGKIKNGSEKRIGSEKFTNLQKFFFLFVLGTILSTLFSGNIERAWYATECKLYGTYLILLCCGMFCVISKGYIEENKIIAISLSLGNSIVFLLAILNRYGNDPLQMQEGLLIGQTRRYISTIGNINILSNYICVFLPLFIGVFLESRKKSHEVIAAVLVYLGIMSGIATNSDSFFLGIASSMICYLWFAMAKKEKLLKYIVVCMICSLSLLTIKLLNQIVTYEYVWSKVQRKLINEVPWGVVLICFVVSLFVVNQIKSEQFFTKLRRIVFSMIGIITIAILCYVLWINLAGKEVGNSILVFSDSWGTNRGYVWTRTLQGYKELPFIQKVLGIGPGSFADFFSKFNVQRAKAGLPNFVDPHSEVLYYFISTGILGGFGYFGMLLSLILRGIKYKTPKTIILTAIGVSWLAQGLVNNPLVFTTPFIFIFLGISEYENKKLMQEH